MINQQLSWIQESREERLEREVQRLKDQCENLRASCDKVRKGQFAKIAKIDRVTNQLEEELAFLKSVICKEKNRIIF